MSTLHRSNRLCGCVSPSISHRMGRYVLVFGACSSPLGVSCPSSDPIRSQKSHFSSTINACTCTSSNPQAFGLVHWPRAGPPTTPRPVVECSLLLQLLSNSSRRLQSGSLDLDVTGGGVAANARRPSPGLPHTPYDVCVHLLAFAIEWMDAAPEAWSCQRARRLSVAGAR